MKFFPYKRCTKYYGRDKYEKYYFCVLHNIRKISTIITPYFRRMIRFIALPYCFIWLVDWKECKLPKTRVALDFLYIFFFFKSFPDHYSRCRLWEKDKKLWKYYYGSNYDPYQRAKLRKFIQPKFYEILYENKQVCYQLCLAANLPLPEQYAILTTECDYINKIASILRKYPKKKLIIKPIDGRAGEDILLALNDDDRFVIKNATTFLPLRELVLSKNYVVQEFVSQSEKLNRVAPSVNTVRLVTMLIENQNVFVLGAYIRFGINDSFTDNVSKGGIAAAIDTTNGCISNQAIDQKGRTYNTHPNSNIKFRGFEIPFWPEVIELARKTAIALPYHKLIGHDIAIGESGPIILELNSIYDNVGFEQKCGPILINEEILKHYGRYDLLINQYQKKLYKLLAL